MSDGVVVVAPDSTGKKIDTVELTRDDGTVVERQRIVLGDSDNSVLAATRVLQQRLQVEDRDTQILEKMCSILEEINFKLGLLLGD
jgi:hypothetical protein